MKKQLAEKKILSQNRKARHEYTILEVIEAGVVLMGSEVKSLRLGKCSISEAYATDENGEMMLINSDIPEYFNAGRFNHHPKRHRKLLLHRKQISKLMGAIHKKKMTLVPLSMYFNEDGRVKIELGLAEGRQSHDKREAIKDRDWQRQKERIMRAKN